MTVEPGGKRRPEHLFVLRMWREEGGRDAAWRGCIDHIPTSQRIYFANLSDLTDFIQLHLRHELESSD